MENMFCFQCQEAAKGIACTVKGVCGKDDRTSNLMDLLLHVTKGIGVLASALREKGYVHPQVDHFVLDALFCTITNANFDEESISRRITGAIALRDELREKSRELNLSFPSISELTYQGSPATYVDDAPVASILKDTNEDIRSLKSLVMYGLKGMAAYAEHACNLAFEKEEVHVFIQKALSDLTRMDIGADELVALTLETGKYGVETMALLDQANTSAYGNPEVTKVNIGVGNKPGILISGHDLKDMEDLLAQTEGTGVDVYTHSEMLPAHYYPAFKKYKHFVGNYGNAWWQQKEEFSSFNGPILFTTNCIVPPSKGAVYADRIYTTGSSGLTGCKHIKDRENGKAKDFSEIIAHALRCEPPVEIEKGEIVGGFAHAQVLALADKVVDAVKSGAIKKFVVMAGCDGRMNSRSYYTDFASALPSDSVILTAGCAKYRYNKLPLGDIGGIPRVLDAGQCNDSYSLAVIALKLKEVFGLNDINDLPIVYNIAWYEQKAVIVLLALLYLGVKKIHLGPTLPAFLSPGVASVLVEKFGIAGITSVEEDLETFFN